MSSVLEQQQAKSGEGGKLSAAALELAEAFRGAVRLVIRLRGRDTHLGEAELSYAQLELLSELFRRGEMPAGELAAAARISPGTATQMLDHLAQAGHVERVRSSSDRRVVVSRLTPEGMALVTAKRDAWEARWQHALESISERDLRAAAKVLRVLQEVYEQEPPCSSRPTSEG